jgi:hypothetical protein
MYGGAEEGYAMYSDHDSIDYNMHNALGRRICNAF